MTFNPDWASECGVYRGSSSVMVDAVVDFINKFELKDFEYPLIHLYQSPELNLDVFLEKIFGTRVLEVDPEKFFGSVTKILSAHPGCADCEPWLLSAEIMYDINGTPTPLIFKLSVTSNYTGLTDCGEYCDFKAELIMPVHA